MTQEIPGPGRLIGDTIALLVDNAPTAILAIGGLATLATLADSYLPGTTSVLPLNIATVVASYFVTRQLLGRLGLIQSQGPGGFGSFFGANLLSGLGILLATLALILPGIYVSARWTATGPIVIAENPGAAAAIDASWQRTRGHGLGIAVAMIVVFLPMLGLIALAALPPEVEGATLVAIDAAANLCVYLASVAGWHFAVAVYVASSVDAPDALEEVFA